jgi:hypothetical protein
MKAAAVVLILACLTAPVVHADATVTACQADTQTGAGVNLAQALATGGTIFFNCPANSVIRVTGRWTVIQRSHFIGNASGVLFHGGLIEDSSFVQNSGVAVRLGIGQIDTLLRHNAFTGNGRALELSQRSAFGTSSTARLRANRFEGHTRSAVVFFDNAQEARDFRLPQATIDALERLPPARFSFAYDRFLGNAGPDGAAIDVDLRKSNGMSLTGGLFVDNKAAASGGAILLRGGSLAIDHSLFRANRAAGAGTAIHAAPGNGAQLSLANSLVVENAGPGAAIEAEGATLANVTIASNEGIGLALRGRGSVANSILAQNRGGNCSGIAATFRGGNLQFGAEDCPGILVSDPYLDPLYVPELGSAALRLGDAAVCGASPVSGSDLMFQGRGTNACALGAFEHPPLRRLPRWREVPLVPPGGIQ